MASKKKGTQEAAVLGADVEKYSRQIWLAGLGAYAKMSKDGVKFFESLVADGEKAEEKVKTVVNKPFDGVKESTKSARSKVGTVKDLALGKWGELEEAFDKRLNNAMARLGVPSRVEVQALNDKIDALTAKIEALTGVSAKSVKPVKNVAKPAPKAAVKPAVKKPAVKASSKASAAKSESVKPAPKRAAKPAVKPVETPAAPVETPAVEAQTPANA